MPIKESLYKVTEHSRDVILNKGFNYKGRLFEKTMSTLLFKEENRTNILSKIEAVFYEVLESVKDIKKHFDYSKKKDDREFN